MTSGRLTYVGHATVLIELDGVALLTDPVLRDRVGHVSRIAPSVTGALRPDAILVSHAHRDHLDVPSLRRLPAAAQAFAPEAAAAIVRRTGRAVTELAAGQQVRVGALEVTAVEAVHDGRRIAAGPARDALGYLVDGSARIYFAGDTDLFDGMRDLAPDIDVALLPIWGWGPKVPTGHLDPERAARAVGMVNPRVAIPIHWGTYASPRTWWRDDPALPAREFERFCALHAPGVAVRVLSPGESCALAGVLALAEVARVDQVAPQRGDERLGLGGHPLAVHPPDRDADLRGAVVQVALECLHDVVGRDHVPVRAALPAAQEHAPAVVVDRLPPDRHDEVLVAERALVQPGAGRGLSAATGHLPTIAGLAPRRHGARRRPADRCAPVTPTGARPCAVVLAPTTAGTSAGMAQLPPPDPFESLGAEPGDVEITSPTAVYLAGPPSEAMERLTDAILAVRPGMLIVVATG